MKKKMTYSDAYAKLKILVQELEDGNIPLDEIAEKTKQANALIAICEAKLRSIEGDVEKNKQ